MNEPHDQIEVSGDEATRSSVEPPPYGESLQFSRSMLQQGIDQLRRLRDDYRQARMWLEEMGRQFAQQEAKVSQRLHEAMASAQGGHGCSVIGIAPVSWSVSPGRPAHGLTLHVQTLGKFKVYHHDQAVSLGSSKKGRAVFRYLVTCPEKRAARDVLLELFWPGESVEKAGHKLHIAISSLRQALKETIEVELEEDSILFEDECYYLNSALDLRLDVDEFTARCQEAERLERENRHSEAIAEYEAALALYRGDFLTEDLYADWTVVPRARLEEMYLTLLGCLAAHHLDQGRFAESISCCRQILAKDSFREDAYRQLMCCYSRMGRRNQALREFHACEELLHRELGVRPMQETVALYERIAQEEAV